MTQLATKALLFVLKPWYSLKKALTPKKKKGAKTSFIDKALAKEFLGLLCAAMTLVITLALLSYDQSDNALQVGQGVFHNWLGPVGAISAFRILSNVGIWAVLVPAMLALGTLLIFFQRLLISPSRLLAILLLVLGLSPLLAHFWPAKLSYDFMIAGHLGLFLSTRLGLYGGSMGLFIMAFLVSLAGLSLLIQRPYVVRSLLTLFYTWRWLGAWLKNRFAPKLVTKEEAPLAAAPIPIPIRPVLRAELEEALPSNNEIQIIERDRLDMTTALKEAEKDCAKRPFSFALPPLKLLDYDVCSMPGIDSQHLKQEAEKLKHAFLQFGIEGTMREIRPGPVVTLYEFVPAPGIKLSRIAALSDDIAMAMSAVQVRIVTPIPGKGAVGIEVPNARRETVYLKEIVADERYRKEPHKLCMAVGKDVEGMPWFMNLADMPHVLIAGTTGSGKSVSVNAMICSILYRATPDEVRFLFIDPKMLELSIYNGIPHLLLPPIIDSKKAGNALRWAVKEMDERYALMKEASVRDITAYNECIKANAVLNTLAHRPHEHLPYLVIVVDEYADLLAVAGKEVEGYIMRLAQKARAAGIHVMLATQRPSVDVITGVIKANFPVRMGFRLASSHDSKTIINKTGAEKLLGRGDVLIMPPGTSDLFRVHGAFVSEKELMRVVEFWRAQKPPAYRDEIAEFEESDAVSEGFSEVDKKGQDEKFEEALQIVRQYKKCSTSFMQRQLSIGYNRAARLVEQMEKAGLVGPVLNAKGEREIFLDQ